MWRVGGGGGVRAPSPSESQLAELPLISAINKSEGPLLSARHSVLLIDYLPRLRYARLAAAARSVGISSATLTCADPIPSDSRSGRGMGCECVSVSLASAG